MVPAGLAKGASHGEDLDAGTSVIHLATACLQAGGWYEYVQSDSNWSDGASRKLEGGEWIRKQGFEIKRGEIPVWPWLAPADERVGAVKAAMGRPG